MWFLIPLVFATDCILRQRERLINNATPFSHGRWEFELSGTCDSDTEVAEAIKENNLASSCAEGERWIESYRSPNKCVHGKYKSLIRGYCK